MLGQAENPSELYSLWAYNMNALEGYRYLSCFSDDVENQLPADLQQYRFGGKADAYLLSHFENSNFFYLSNEIVFEHMNDRGVTFPIDFSISMDSNYVGYISRFVHGQSLGSNAAAFIDSFAYIKRNNLNTDINPYLIENFEDAQNDQNRELIVERFADYWLTTTCEPRCENPSSIADFDFEMSREEARKEAEIRSADIFDSNLAEGYYGQIQTMYYTCYFILLKTFIIEFTNRNRPSHKKFQLLLQSVHSDLRRMMERELVLAYLYFCSRASVPFYASFHPSGNAKKDVVAKLRNMAWDIYFYRFCETSATMETSIGETVSHFYIPFFITFDKKLAHLYSLFSIKGYILNRKKESSLSVPSKPIQKIITEPEAYQILSEYLSEAMVKDRMSKDSLSVNDLKNLCGELEDKIRLI